MGNVSRSWPGQSNRYLQKKTSNISNMFQCIFLKDFFGIKIDVYLFLFFRFCILLFFIFFVLFFGDLFVLFFIYIFCVNFLMVLFVHFLCYV